MSPLSIVFANLLMSPSCVIGGASSKWSELLLLHAFFSYAFCLLYPGRHWLRAPTPFLPIYHQSVSWLNLRCKLLIVKQIHLLLYPLLLLFKRPSPKLIGQIKTVYPPLPACSPLTASDLDVRNVPIATNATKPIQGLHCL